MKLFSVVSLILAASTCAHAGVIVVSDQLGALNATVAAADPVSSLPTRSVRCGSMCLLSESFSLKLILFRNPPTQ